jgi:putative transposase
LMSWQVHKRFITCRSRMQTLPTFPQRPNVRWATDLCRVWCGKDGWASLAFVIDCHIQELLGWHLNRSGKSAKAESALEYALISRFRLLGNVSKPSCCVQTMVRFSAPEATPHWCETTVCISS